MKCMYIGTTRELELSVLEDENHLMLSIEACHLSMILCSFLCFVVTLMKSYKLKGLESQDNDFIAFNVNHCSILSFSLSRILL